MQQHRSGPNKYTDCANFNENIDHLIKGHFSYWVSTAVGAASIAIASVRWWWGAIFTICCRRRRLYHPHCHRLQCNFMKNVFRRRFNILIFISYIIYVCVLFFRCLHRLRYSMCYTLWSISIQLTEKYVCSVGRYVHIFYVVIRSSSTKSIYSSIWAKKKSFFFIRSDYIAYFYLIEFARMEEVPSVILCMCCCVDHW